MNEPDERLKRIWDRLTSIENMLSADSFSVANREDAAAAIKLCKRELIPEVTNYECFINDGNIRIVDTDNFGGDYPNERFLLWPMRKERAEKIAEILNEGAGPHATRYYKTVPYNYKLEPGFEP